MKSIFIVSGEKESGKTTFLLNLLSLLQLNGFLAAGFVALHDVESDCYQIKDINTNVTTPLMQRVATFEERPHHFKFFPQGIELGYDSIRKLMVHPPHIAVIDEIGGYELRGKLWSNSFTQLVESSVPLIFTVKDRLLDKVVAKWGIEPSHIFNSADFYDADKAFKLIKSSL